MEDKEILNIWKSYDKKLDQILILNKELIYEITKEKLNKTITSLRLPKQIMIAIGIPYTLLLSFITFVTFKAEAMIMMFGFGIISLIMISIIIGYIYHLFLIRKISRSEEIIEVQRKIAELKISSFNIARLAIIQLPFWSICWISMDALKNSPIIYGGINLLAFLGLSCFTYWIYNSISIHSSKSTISKLIFTGREWEPILKASEILNQLKEYKNE